MSLQCINKITLISVCMLAGLIGSYALIYVVNHGLII